MRHDFAYLLTLSLRLHDLILLIRSSRWRVKLDGWIAAVDMMVVVVGQTRKRKREDRQSRDALFGFVCTNVTRKSSHVQMTVSVDIVRDDDDDSSDNDALALPPNRAIMS